VTAPDASAPPAPLRVALVEDRREIREGLAALIGGTEGFAFTEAFRSMEEAIPAIAHRTPDVLLADIGLPGMSGIDGIRILKQSHPRLVILTLTVYDDDDRIFAALCAGACGYLLKNTPPVRLLDSIREAAAGGAPMSPQVARKVISLFRQVQPPPQSDYDLTPHEKRLLGLLVEGHNYKTAAVELGVSVNTVAFHVRHVYEKLQVHTQSQAVVKALRERLVL
jgi:DNA-binding NarL/FixJ family response regulator